MNYTKKAMAIIKEDINYAYGSWIEGNQLSEKDYAEEQERLAVGILEDLAAPALYEALKQMSEWMNSQLQFANEVTDYDEATHIKGKEALAKADRK